MPTKFVAIQVNQSFLFALGEDGQVYQLVDVTDQNEGSIITTFVKRRVWKAVTDLTFTNGEWR